MLMVPSDPFERTSSTLVAASKWVYAVAAAAAVVAVDDAAIVAVVA